MCLYLVVPLSLLVGGTLLTIGLRRDNEEWFLMGFLTITLPSLIITVIHLYIHINYETKGFDGSVHF